MITHTHSVPNSSQTLEQSSLMSGPLKRSLRLQGKFNLTQIMALASSLAKEGSGQLLWVDNFVSGWSSSSCLPKSLQAFITWHYIDTNSGPQSLRETQTDSLCACIPTSVASSLPTLPGHQPQSSTNWFITYLSWKLKTEEHIKSHFCHQKPSDTRTSCFIGFD